MGILKVIAVAYNRDLQLQILINCFLIQTNPGWELYIVHDGPAPANVKAVIPQDPRVIFLESPDRRGIYGHPNRRMMLKEIHVTSEDYILITNDDNYYVPEYVRYVMGQANCRTGMIYCDTLHNYYSYDILRSQLKRNFIDMGAFVVKADVAKAVGFNSDEYAADGIYCEECAEYCRTHSLVTTYIQKPLFIHN